MAVTIAAAVALATVVAAGLARAAAAPVPEPEGYRLENYKAPTPMTIRGGIAVTTVELRALLDDPKVILIDVLPQRKRPDNLPASTLWIEKPRRDIPGSVWLPDVGRGALSPALDDYFRDNLARLTGNDRDRRLVFYCLADCWMSWNAAKRAIGYGYRHVYWYRDGTDGWTAMDLPVEERKPVPMSDGAPPVQ